MSVPPAATLAIFPGLGMTVHIAAYGATTGIRTRLRREEYKRKDSQLNPKF